MAREARDRIDQRSAFGGGPAHERLADIVGRDQSLMSIRSITTSSLGRSIEAVDALLIASTTS